jgi:hypothetical protein
MQYLITLLQIAMAAIKGTPTIVKAEGDDEEIKLVEMPESYVRWVLAQEIRPVFSLDDYYSFTSDVVPQKWHDEQLELLASARESMLAWREEFFKHQAWVREEYEREGRVMVPAADDAHPQISEEQEELNRLALQEEIDRVFAQAAEEFERGHPELPGIIAEAERKAAEDELQLLGGAATATADASCY